LYKSGILKIPKYPAHSSIVAQNEGSTRCQIWANAVRNCQDLECIPAPVTSNNASLRTDIRAFIHNKHQKMEAMLSKFTKGEWPALITASIPTHDALFPALHGNGVNLLLGVLGRDGWLRRSLLLSLLLLPELALAVVLVLLHIGDGELDGGRRASEHGDDVVGIGWETWRWLPQVEVA
jgi:hypothetical protein